MSLTNDKLVTKFKFNFSYKFPFLAGLCNNVKVNITEEDIKTPDGAMSPAYCNGLEITINKKFIEKDFKSAFSVFSHEVMHIALQHQVRYTEMLEHGIDKEWRYAYNVLADLRVNTLLKNEGLQAIEGEVDSYNIIKILEGLGFKKKEGAIQGVDTLNDIVDTMVSDKDISSDRAFSLLRCYYEKDEKQGDGEGEDGQSGGDVGKSAGSKRDGFNGNDIGAYSGKSMELKDKIDEKMIGSLINGQQAGKELSDLQRHFEKMYYDKKIDYGKIIRNSIMKEMRKELDANRVHRKSIALDYAPYLNARRKNPYKYLIAVAIDTSQSMNRDSINKIMGEIFQLVKRYKNVTIDLFTCDFRLREYIQDIDYKSFEKKIKTIGGYGGTSFKPVFNKIIKVRRERPYRTLVYFTDGEGDNDDLKAVNGLKCYWIVDNKYNSKNIRFPFGVVYDITN